MYLHCDKTELKAFQKYSVLHYTRGKLNLRKFQCETFFVLLHVTF